LAGESGEPAAEWLLQRLQASEADTKRKKQTDPILASGVALDRTKTGRYDRAAPDPDARETPWPWRARGRAERKARSGSPD
jgi:hypothetical protein